MSARFSMFLLLVVIAQTAGAQPIGQRLERAWAGFEKDSQLKAAIASIYVVDAGSNAVVFQRNAAIGLAPASTQKVITAASAYELLGRDFRYETSLGYTGRILSDTLFGELVFAGSGD